MTVMLGVAVSIPKALRAEDLTGTVADAITNNPIAGATITVIGTNISQATNASGAYTITGLADGTYTIRAEADGYVPQEKSVTLGGSTIGQSVAAGMVPRNPTAYYDAAMNRIRLYGGETGRVGTMEFTLCTIDGRVAFRCSLSGGGVKDAGAQDIAAGKYVWSISRGRDGYVLANGTMDISR